MFHKIKLGEITMKKETLEKTLVLLNKEYDEKRQTYSRI